MTVEQKARQLALTLVGDDQNLEPLIEVLMEMAEWQKQQMMKKAISGEVKEGLAVGDFGWEDSGWIETDTFRIEKYALKANDKVKLIIVKES